MYLKSGDRYSVLSRGLLTGTAINEDQSESGDVPRSDARYEGPLFNDMTAVLLTNAAVPKTSPQPSEPLSSRQQEEALRLARRLFLDAGLAPSLVDPVKPRKIEMVRLLPNPKRKLVASFWIDRLHDSGISHNLFVVADEQHASFLPELVLLKISRTGTDGEQADLVDHADLLRMGDEEIVTETTYYENYRYRIYRRGESGVWKKILESETLGCE